MFGSKKGYPELASDEYKNTNFLNLNKENTVYFIHILAAIAALYFTLIHEYKDKIPTLLATVIIAVAFAILLQLYIFEDAVQNGFKIGKPKDNTINWQWDDGSKKWYNDIPFFLMWIFSLYYGLHALKLGGSWSNFEFELPDEIKSISKFIFIIPLFGFLYYFYYIVIAKGELIKPLPDRLYGFERPLALTFSLVFIPILFLLTIQNDFLSKIFTNRFLAAIFLFGCIYIVVWRLNGGLFLKKPQVDELYKAVDEYERRRLTQ